MTKTGLLTVAGFLALCTAVAAQDADPGQDSKKAEIVNKLNTMRVSVDFNGIPLEEAVSFLRDVSNLNIVIDGTVQAKASDGGLKVTLKVKELLLKSTLKLMLNAHGLSAMYKEGVVLIVPQEQVDKAVTIQIYDARDLLVKLQDFSGPRVELVSPTAQGGKGTPLVGATFTLDEPRATMSEEFIVEMIKTNTGGKTWDDNPNASLSLVNGQLIVAQSKRVHDEIRRFINVLRQFK